jgi:hypothetical protein
MSSLNFRYSIRSNLPAHPESPASIGTKFVNTLEALSRMDPMVFPNWEVMDYPATTRDSATAHRCHNRQQCQSRRFRPTGAIWGLQRWRLYQP